MVQPYIYGRVLYNTCYIWHSEFLKLQYLLPLSEISKFCVTLGIAGFYGVANRNVLNEHRWLGISYLVNLEVSMIVSV